jgi:hypothetical protein
MISDRTRMVLLIGLYHDTEEDIANLVEIQESRVIEITRLNRNEKRRLGI